MLQIGVAECLCKAATAHVITRSRANSSDAARLTVAWGDVAERDWEDALKPSGTNAGVFYELSRLLGTEVKNPYTDPLNKVFLCTEAEVNMPVVWCPPVIRTIQFNPRAMPGYDQQIGDAGKPVVALGAPLVGAG